MQQEIPDFRSLDRAFQQWIADYEFRLLWEGHTWPVDDYGPCPPIPDWWTEKEEQNCHRQSEAIFNMLTRSKNKSSNAQL